MNLWEMYNDKFNFDYEIGLIYYKNGDLVIPSFSKSGKKRNEEPSVYMKIYTEGKNHMYHRILYVSKYKEIPKVVDHIDGDCFNNSIYNLRGVSFRENSINRKICSRNSSGFIGIVKRKNSFIATIYDNKKRIYLGSFSSLEEAILKRKEAEKIYNYHENHGRRSV